MTSKLDPPSVGDCILLLKQMRGYLNHSGDCLTVSGMGPDSDFCTCDVHSVIRNFNRLMKKYAQA